MSSKSSLTWLHYQKVIEKSKYQDRLDGSKLQVFSYLKILTLVLSIVQNYSSVY